MNLQEKLLYHQIHPVKLVTDIGVTSIALYLTWEHLLLPAALVGLVPPILVSAAMVRWTPDLQWLKASRLGLYVRRYMTPVVEAVRLLTLVPMAYGAWHHEPRYIELGLVVLIAAWCNGLIWKR